MDATELMLRAAFTWAKANTVNDGLIKHSGPFEFAAAGRVRMVDRTTNCPHLWWADTGRLVTVSMSPGGRILVYVDACTGHHSMQLDMKLPREFWAEVGR